LPPRAQSEASPVVREPWDPRRPAPDLGWSLELWHKLYLHGTHSRNSPQAGPVPGCLVEAECVGWVGNQMGRTARTVPVRAVRGG